MPTPEELQLSGSRRFLNLAYDVLHVRGPVSRLKW